MTHPTAFTVSLLAWGILQFPEGYANAKATLAAAKSARWGAEYLLKTVAETSNGTQIVYQVTTPREGNLHTAVTRGELNESERGLNWIGSMLDQMTHIELLPL
jgi:hypothetical protein